MVHIARHPIHWHVEHIDHDEPSALYYTDYSDAANAADEAPAMYTIRECTDPACTEE